MTPSTGYGLYEQATGFIAGAFGYGSSYTRSTSNASEFTYFNLNRQTRTEDPLASLQNFQKLEIVGTGTFGRVYLVQNNLTSQFYALKALPKSVLVQKDQVQHIQDEKRILSNLRHPQVVKLHKTYQDNHSLYMLLEFVPGGELFTYLRQEQKFSEHVAKFYAAQIVLILEHLHSIGIAYRDLKPENILLDENGYVKITDFGFAKFVSDRTWTMCGTPEYLAPEVILTKGHDKAVDWWALGILIYEMLHGFPPFHGLSPMDLYNEVLTKPVRCQDHVSPVVSDLILQLLSRDKSRRLGNRAGGVAELKAHRWFAGVDWHKLERRELRPPFVPRVEWAGDTGNYADYPDSEMMMVDQSNSKDEYARYFEGF